MIFVNKVGEKQIVILPGEKLSSIRDQMVELAMENNGGSIHRASRATGLARHTIRKIVNEWEGYCPSADS